MSDDYNLFISWSGARSKWVADAMMLWLPVVLQSVKPWMSSISIDKGTRSANEISDALRSVKMGIVCLTPENLVAPWLLFEAGALSNAVAQKTHVCTYLLGGLSPSQIEKPLGEFQHTSPEKEDTLKLLRTMNSALGNSISDTVLAHSFEGQWPSFEQKLKTMPAEGEAEVVRRDSDDILSEILENTRAHAENLRVLHSMLTQVKTQQNRMRHENSSATSNPFRTNVITAAGLTHPDLTDNLIVNVAESARAATLPDMSEIRRTLQDLSAGLEALQEGDKKPKG